MSEFLEVMKQKKRMCKKYTGGGICQSIDYNKCPLKGHELCSEPITLINIDKIQEGEEIIMRWAAENPEPIYPTWAEWLEKIGVMADIHDRLNNYKQVMEVCGLPLYSIPTEKVFHCIPADIAQKLGLEPKEG